MEEPLPLTYRAAEADQVMAVLRAGESCTIAGIGSVGKSNLLRFLEREDVRQAGLGPDWASYLLVYVDVNKLLAQSLWGLAELVLHQMGLRLAEIPADEALAQKVADLHALALSAQPSPQAALRYLDRAVALLCRPAGRRLVVLLDEFDHFCQLLPTAELPLLRALRALRDDNKGRLMYVVAVRQPLSCRAELAADIEPFEELVSLHTVFLGPYAEDDARLMLRRLEARHNLALDESTTALLLTESGGHPGLLRAAYQAARERPADLPQALRSSPAVQDECERIWLSLTTAEQNALAQLAAHAEKPESPAVLAELRRKGLVRGPQGEEIFAPLLREYVRRRQLRMGPQVRVDRERHLVYVGDKALRLSPLEFKFIACLAENRGRVCSRDELIQAMYSPEAEVDNTCVDAVAKRVRKDFARFGKAGYISTVRGVGFVLTDEEESAR